MAINISTQVKDMLGDYCDIQFLSHEESPNAHYTNQSEDAYNQHVNQNGDDQDGAENAGS